VDELRRAYHDRLAALRGETITLLRDVSVAVENVTRALTEPDPALAASVVADVSDMSERVASVEVDVLDVIAQQAPVGRDLRVVLAAYRIAQLSQLCAGLCRSLAERVGVSAALTAGLLVLVRELGVGTATLLESANGAWIVLDAEQAAAVLAGAESSRQTQRRFLAELFALEGVAVEAAVDLGMVARVYERLTDHAAEVATRVLFVAAGSPREPTPPPAA